MNKREKARRVKYIKTRAVVLKSLVLELKKTTGIDMREDIIGFFQDRFGEVNK